MSHLLQMRGLKPSMAVSLVYDDVVASFTDAWIETTVKHRRSYFCYVASFTDAWIETISVFCDEESVVSHLLQMRGLKRAIMETETTGSASHLLQMRGLKLILIILVICPLVASFTDAWIETFLSESGTSSA